MSDFERAWRAVLMSEPCVYCGGTAAGLDHIIAKSQDGDNNWTNRAPACKSCDNAKGNASVFVYLWAVHKARTRVANREATRVLYGHSRFTFQQRVARIAASASALLRDIRSVSTGP